MTDTIEICLCEKGCPVPWSPSLYDDGERLVDYACTEVRLERSTSRVRSSRPRTLESRNKYETRGSRLTDGRIRVGRTTKKVGGRGFKTLHLTPRIRTPTLFVVTRRYGCSGGRRVETRSVGPNRTSEDRTPEKTKTTGRDGIPWGGDEGYPCLMTYSVGFRRKGFVVNVEKDRFLERR